MPGLGCSTWDLQSLSQRVAFFSCGMQDLVPKPGMEPGLPGLGVEDSILISFFKTHKNNFLVLVCVYMGVPGGSVVQNLPANAGDAGDTGSISGLGRTPGGGNGNPLLYSCLENPMDRGAWWATVHVV